MLCKFEEPGSSHKSSISTDGLISKCQQRVKPSLDQFARLQLQPKDLPLDVENDIRSRILANHRMPAYRHRALTRIRAIVGLGPGGEHSCTAHLTEDLLPRAIVHSAVANFKPLLPPPLLSGTTPNRCHPANLASLSHCMPHVAHCDHILL